MQIRSVLSQCLVYHVTAYTHTYTQNDRNVQLNASHWLNDVTNPSYDYFPDNLFEQIDNTQ